MQVGCLGDIVFEVSDDVIKTIYDAQWGGSVNVGTHTRHLNNALQEFTGINPDTFSFSIYLSEHLGVAPIDVIEQIFEYERQGAALPLVIGSKAYGKDRWLITKHDVSINDYDAFGNLTSATVGITLTEYLEA